jgi:hypothetical protein
MICHLKARLVDEFSAATLAFSKMVREQRSIAGPSQNGKYDQLERTLSQARVMAKKAKRVLEEHIAVHRC